MTNTKFVDFKTYCETCAYKDKDGTEEPCDECLRCPARKNSAKPLKWKEKRKK